MEAIYTQIPDRVLIRNESALNRAQRSKRMKKAIDRQAKKLQDKGLEVDYARLEAEYLAAHQENGVDENNWLDDDGYDDLHIDVVGVEPEYVTGDSLDHSFCSSRTYQTKSTSSELDSNDMGLQGRVETPPPPQPPMQNKTLYNSPFSIESLLGS